MLFRGFSNARSLQNAGGVVGKASADACSSVERPSHPALQCLRCLLCLPDHGGRARPHVGFQGLQYVVSSVDGPTLGRRRQVQ